jgi:hypothetical protein
MKQKVFVLLLVGVICSRIIAGGTVETGPKDEKDVKQSTAIIPITPPVPGKQNPGPKPQQTMLPPKPEEKREEKKIDPAFEQELKELHEHDVNRATVQDFTIGNQIFWDNKNDLGSEDPGRRASAARWLVKQHALCKIKELGYQEEIRKKRDEATNETLHREQKESQWNMGSYVPSVVSFIPTIAAGVSAVLHLKACVDATLNNPVSLWSSWTITVHTISFFAPIVNSFISKYFIPAEPQEVQQPESKEKAQDPSIKISTLCAPWNQHARSIELEFIQLQYYTPEFLQNESKKLVSAYLQKYPDLDRKYNLNERHHTRHIQKPV